MTSGQSDSGFAPDTEMPRHSVTKQLRCERDDGLALARQMAKERDDVEAIGKAIHDYACGCDRPWPTNANYEEMARAAAGAILGRS